MLTHQKQENITCISRYIKVSLYLFRISKPRIPYIRKIRLKVYKFRAYECQQISPGSLLPIFSFGLASFTLNLRSKVGEKVFSLSFQPGYSLCMLQSCCQLLVNFSLFRSIWPYKLQLPLEGEKNQGSQIALRNSGIKVILSAVNQLPLTDKYLTTISQIRGLKKKKKKILQPGGVFTRYTKCNNFYHIHKL